MLGHQDVDQEEFQGAAAGKSGIFIHMGNNPSWSDGCIVIKEAELLKIWNAIIPKDAQNVSVVVKDQATTSPTVPPLWGYPSADHFGPGCRVSDWYL